MAPEHATDYVTLKKTLLQRFRFTEEGYRTKFRSAKPDNSETGTQFAGRLLGYFDHWQEMAKTDRTYDALRDKIVSEQFLAQCHEKLAVFLKERNCESLEKLAEATDHYLEAQGLINLGKCKGDILSKPPGQTRTSERQDDKERPQCFLCNKKGHRAADCWTNTRGPGTKPPFVEKAAALGIKQLTAPKGPTALRRPHALFNKEMEPR